MNINFKALGLVVVLQLALTAGFRPGVAAPRARAARSASGARATPSMVLSDPTRVDEHSQHHTTTHKHLTPSPELESFESGVKAMLADKRWGAAGPRACAPARPPRGASHSVVSPARARPPREISTKQGVTREIATQWCASHRRETAGEAYDAWVCDGRATSCC